MIRDGDNGEESVFCTTIRKCMCTYSMVEYVQQEHAGLCPDERLREVFPGLQFMGKVLPVSSGCSEAKRAIR